MKVIAAAVVLLDGSLLAAFGADDEPRSKAASSVPGIVVIGPGQTLLPEVAVASVEASAPVVTAPARRKAERETRKSEVSEIGTTGEGLVYKRGVRLGDILRESPLSHTVIRSQPGRTSPIGESDVDARTLGEPRGRDALGVRPESATVGARRTDGTLRYVEPETATRIAVSR
jgi:hypothetical protein